MKKTIKSLSLILVLVLMVGLLAACGTKPEDAAKKTVETFFTDLKNGNAEGVSKAVVDSKNFDLIQGAGSGAAKDAAKDLSKLMFGDLKYEIKSVKLDGDNKAVVTADITSIDYTTVMKTVMGVVLEKAFSNLDATEAEIEQITIDALKEALTAKDLAQKTTKDVKINLEKKGDTWKIKADSDFQKALLGGFDSNSLTD